LSNELGECATSEREANHLATTGELDWSSPSDRMMRAISMRPIFRRLAIGAIVVVIAAAAIGAVIDFFQKQWPFIIGVALAIIGSRFFWACVVGSCTVIFLRWLLVGPIVDAIDRQTELIENLPEAIEEARQSAAEDY